MNLDKVISEAEQLALVEIEKFGTPKLEHFVIALDKGKELADKLGAQRDIVILGTMLMDLKIGECLQENRLAEHIERSAVAASVFLKKFAIEEDTFNKIISCIREHHGAERFSCREAEICANADCYRFLSPAGALNYIAMLGKRGLAHPEIMNQLEAKMSEKHRILSLEICSQECEEFYQQFKEIIKKAR